MDTWKQYEGSEYVECIEDASCMSIEPMVSVCVTTFNHEKFIQQTLDSILEQQVSFSYEIIIGEDCSTDGTRKFVQQYQAQHPDRIRLRLSRANLYGINRHLNSLGVYSTARAKYIALLEGDDYWADPLKLQKQVDFLEEHPECSMCHTNALQLIVRDNILTNPIHSECDIPGFGTSADILERNYIVSCTAMFRTDEYTFPEWGRRLRQGDWTSWMLCSLKGTLGYLADCTAVYRWHDHGVWGGASADAMYQSAIETYTCFRQHLPDEHHQQIDRKIAEMKFRLAYSLAHAGGHSVRAWRSALVSASKVWKDRSISRSNFCKTWLMLCLPVRLLKKMRRLVSGR